MNKAQHITAIFLIGISSFNINTHAQSMQSEEAKIFYKNVFKHTVENMQATKKDYAQYFAKDFVMYMNGKTYFFDDYVQFMLNLQKTTKSVNIYFKEMISEDNNVSTVHTNHIKNKNGSEIELAVLSFFKIESNKFISGYELTRITSEALYD